MYDPFLLALIAIPLIAFVPYIIMSSAIGQTTKPNKRINQRLMYLPADLLELQTEERNEREDALALEAQEKEEMKQLLQNLLKCQQVMARAAKENNRLLAELIQALKERQD